MSANRKFPSSNEVSVDSNDVKKSFIGIARSHGFQRMKARNRFVRRGADTQHRIVIEKSTFGNQFMVTLEASLLAPNQDWTAYDKMPDLRAEEHSFDVALVRRFREALNADTGLTLKEREERFREYFDVTIEPWFASFDTREQLKEFLAGFKMPSVTMPLRPLYEKLGVPIPG